jgi:hypothetical protein
MIPTPMVAATAIISAAMASTRRGVMARAPCGKRPARA